MVSFLPALFLGLQVANGVPKVDVLNVDPLLLVQAREVWSLIGRKDNPVWPGWDARKTPILIYFPGKQDLLINHPKPPEGFRKYGGPVKSSIGPIYLRDDKTVFDLDGQNTSTQVGGIETLVIADTLSARRQWVESVAPSVVANPVTAKEEIASGLFPNPYDSMVMFTHEAFHVYQRKMVPNKAGNESVLARYPSLSAENNAAIAYEGDLLASAIGAKTVEECRRVGLQWLALRQYRRSILGSSVSEYEDGTEFSEGLAKYVEYRSLQCFEGKKPSAEMWLLEGFRGYGDLSAQRQRLIRQMKGFMNGANVVNGDLYGASSIRFRLYYSGMAVGLLLDRLAVKWYDRIFQKGTSLTGLATEALHATPAELAAALSAAQASDAYRKYLGEKQKLASDGEVYIQAEVDKFASAPGELVLDYSKVGASKVGLSYTPFGILRVSDDETIYRLIPIRGSVGSLSFSEDAARPVLQDRKGSLLRFQLTGLPEVSDSVLDGKDLTLPGVTLKNVHGRVRVAGRRVVVEIVS